MINKLNSGDKNKKSRVKKVLLLLAEGFEIYEASAFIDVIGWNLVEGDGSTELFTCGLKEEVRSTFNQRIIVDYTIDEINSEEFSALAIPGGFKEYNFYEDAYADKFSQLIQAFNSQNKTIASVCTGAFPLANSGVLTGRNGTTYNKNPVRHETLGKMGVTVLSEPIVMDGNIITSWNPSTAMDVAFRLLENLTSKEQANKIRDLMGFETE